MVGRVLAAMLGGLCAVGVACSTFGDGDDGAGTAGTASSARIPCDGTICSDGKICCEKDDGTHACATREECTGNDELAVLCDEPSDCAGGSCCVRLPDSYHVESVSCGECPAAENTFRACDPQKPSCEGGTDCVTLDTAQRNSLQLTIYVCR